MQSWSSAPVPTLPGRGPELRLYDTSDRQVRPVVAGPTATMYVCGITPYDATHLGHAATYLAFDLVQRLWLDLGHDVHYVQNVTDVDDPLLERAQTTFNQWLVLVITSASGGAISRDQLVRRITTGRKLPGSDVLGAVDDLARPGRAEISLAQLRINGNEV